MSYFKAPFLLALIIIGLCSPANTKSLAIQNSKDITTFEVDKALSNVFDKHKINTAGIGVIKAGKLIWQKQYGQQSPGVPASSDTLFNVGSITKTVTAETILRLVAKNQLSLTEPMAKFWIDPDLTGDKNLFKLNAKIAITHTAGFMNWRFFSDDYKLKFLSEPGTQFRYSGEGFEYLAKYASKKTGVSFDTLVNNTIFEPLGMADASVIVKKTNFSRIASAFDEKGKFYGHYCHPQGYCKKENDVSAAGDMVITVDDYAKFLTSSMNGEGLTEQLKLERDKIQSVQVSHQEIDCSQAPKAQCPIRLGYGLGWNIAELDNDRLIGHRGSDWSVVALAYYYKSSNDGLIVFLNAPNKAGIAAMIDVLEILDPHSPEIHGYKFRLARAN